MSTTHPEQSEQEGVEAVGGESLATLFAQVCKRYGERIAVSLGEETLSYSDLNHAANRVAATLAEEGAGAGTIVAICMERSIDMIVAMLGVVKCGAAYLPIDATYPVQRIADTLDDAAPVAVITSRSVESRLFDVAIKCLPLEDLKRRECERPVAADVHAQSPAYVIYTSGSTGRPKGVVVSHGNVVRLLRETEPWFHFTQRDVWTMFHSFAFDFSVWEIWGCLLTGGRLAIVPFAVSRSPQDFYALLLRERVTVLNQTPSAFVLLNDVDEWLRSKLSLRVVIFGGEALSLGLLRGWIERHGDNSPQLVNMYGITETTVHVTYRRIFAADIDDRESLIGEPIPDMQVYLLDDELRPVADGEEGEICVGGGGVTLGYLNRPELTAERFCADPARLDGSRLYRSGDLARRRADGELVYLGRRDFQVKINGFRIELGEVEAAIAQHPAVKQVSVVAEENTRLVAYFSTAHGSQLPANELSEFLGKRLPTHMMPSLYRQVQGFSLNANGKVDRAALRSVATSPKMRQQPSVRSSSPMEESVAAIWRRVLNVQKVSHDDNFFDVGGTSLLLIAVRTGLQERLGRAIPITWLFECTTVRALSRRLDEPTGLVAAGAGNVVANAGKQRAVFARARAARGEAR
jgi:amino acid adenylation domain-containing protein